MSEERTEAEKIDPNVHVDSDDARYDGFRIREYWIATAMAPDNQEAPLYVERGMAIKHHMVMGPAMASDERRRVHLRAFAQEMAETFGAEVRIRHFVPEGDDEVFIGSSETKEAE